MDKKNVQILKAKILLTEKKFCHDVEKLSSHFKRKDFKNMMIFFL
jgi:hypothetical protein